MYLESRSHTMAKPFAHAATNMPIFRLRVQPIIPLVSLRLGDHALLHQGLQARFHLREPLRFHFFPQLFVSHAFFLRKLAERGTRRPGTLHFIRRGADHVSLLLEHLRLARRDLLWRGSEPESSEPPMRRSKPCGEQPHGERGCYCISDCFLFHSSISN